MKEESRESEGGREERRKEGWGPDRGAPHLETPGIGASSLAMVPIYTTTTATNHHSSPAAPAAPSVRVLADASPCALSSPVPSS